MANVKLRDRNGNDVIYKGVETVTFDTDVDDTTVVFTEGVKSSATVELDFSNGEEQVLNAPSGKLLNQVTINRPTTLIPGNIAKDVVIAGVTGIFEGGSDERPTLNKVTIARNGDTLTVTNPSTNGNFVKGYKVFSGEIQKANFTGNTYDIATAGAGNHVLTAKAYGDNFNDSPASAAITVDVWGIYGDLEGLTFSSDRLTISDGLPYSIKLKPEDGKFLPEFIDVTMANKECKYEWDSYTGLIAFDGVTGDVRIAATAFDADKLRRPVISLNENENTLSITPPRYSETTRLYANDVEVYTYVDKNKYSVDDLDGVTYGFTTNADGYYESTNQKKGNTYSMCRINFNLEEAKTVTLSCISNGESGYDYGIISQLDTELAKSTSDDGATGSTKVKHNFKGEASTKVVAIEYSIPAGNHFIDVKYRKDSSGDNGYDSFQFMVSW